MIVFWITYYCSAFTSTRWFKYDSMGKSVSYGDTLPHTVVGVCGEFQRTGRFLQRGI